MYNKVLFEESSLVSNMNVVGNYSNLCDCEQFNSCRKVTHD